MNPQFTCGWLKHLNVQTDFQGRHGHEYVPNP